jgi:hypothetical protein
MNGRLAWHLAVAISAFTLSGCASSPPCDLCDAIEARDAGAVNSLLAQGSPVTTQVLELAADPNRVIARTPPGGPEAVDREIVERLIEQGNVNARWMRTGSRLRNSSSSGSQTAVYLAEALMELWGEPALVQRLVARGLDVRGVPGGQALRQAVISRRLDAVRALVDAGAPVNHVGVNALEATTPLAEAIQTCDPALIALLESAGAVEWMD